MRSIPPEEQLLEGPRLLCRGGRSGSLVETFHAEKTQEHMIQDELLVKGGFDI